MANNYLGLNEDIRKAIIKELVGLGSSESSSVNIKSRSNAWLTISSTDPGEVLTEPSVEDSNYKRFQLSEKGVSNFIKLENTGATAKSKDEIKFRRSTTAWQNSYPYFAICSSETGTSMSNIVAWGLLETPVTVNAENIVPLFEPDSFVISFP